ncbi:hypothetical protein SynROS8604_02950 [Synechococcus sp. ROS8604]|nr:hypothetical protein SynROS8604_02950 [Synechococcus sp. ROS8604]
MVARGFFFELLAVSPGNELAGCAKLARGSACWNTSSQASPKVSSSSVGAPSSNPELAVSTLLRTMSLNRS